MAKSFGEALAKGEPVALTAKDKRPQVLYHKGKEAEALKLLDDMGIIELVLMDVERAKPDRNNEGERKCRKV